MEANFFRFLAVELGTLLVGRRLDKIYQPVPDVWTIKIQNSGSPLFTLFRPAKSAGHLFLSGTKPSNPQQVAAMAMWFRKRVANRKVLAWHADWPSLRLALELSPRDTPPCGRFLLLDCREGLSLVNELDENFFKQPDWPALEDVIADQDIWREYPQISPPLRKQLAGLNQDKALPLYLALAGASVDQFFLATRKGEPQPPTAWAQEGTESFRSALEAANAYGERTLFPLLETVEERPEKIQLSRARKKIKRNLAKLEEEAARLEQLSEERIRGEALQAALYRLKDAEGLESVSVEHPKRGPITVLLNPHFSVTENMERYFRLAGKARRGFPHVERRRQELLAQLNAVEEGILPDRFSTISHSEAQAPSPLPTRYRGLAVSLFRSSDGFTMIRGKNKQANHAMLSKAASPFDYWFHLADGPSSHLILKRDHPGQEVPQTTLAEAAILCGLKSSRSEDRKAEVMYALVKDVRKVKGFAQGQVRVDQRAGTLLVELDASLEIKLSIAAK
ncbi:NFACT RNA binding domain-containing protein [Pseudodesulfovibrio sp.]|uniref:NFACT RNA binding domain-containing protein n=1 Tax=unclassified Pseudodesulfovibrio TaxID=2661612 RepID=UPI003B002EDC